MKASAERFDPITGQRVGEAPVSRLRQVGSGTLHQSLPHTTEPMLETRDLTIRFGGHVAVDHVSCAFRPGTLTALMGLALGHWLDRTFGTRVFFSAPLLMIGVAVGFWSAWKWMHRQQRNHHE